MQAPVSAIRHYRRQQRLQAMTIAAVRRQWRTLDPSRSFVEQILELVGPAILRILLAAQSATLDEAEQYQQQVLQDLGLLAAGAGGGLGAAASAADSVAGLLPRIDPVGFLGRTGDGREVAGLIGQAAVHTGRSFNRLRSAAEAGPRADAGGVLDLVDRPDHTGFISQEALRAGEQWIEQAVETLLADVARDAAQAAFVSTPGVTGYVRVLSPPSCPRCVVLAGKRYRWNEGFLRHPNCNCFHVPEAESLPGDTTDPYEYFRSLSRAEQDKAFTKAGARAIRDGADIFQVVNARRGMSPSGLMTDEGMSRRGNASLGLRRWQRRAMPDLIYRWADGDQDRARELLVEHGFILPGGQNPAGSLVGQREGFGQLGAGGARRAASTAVVEARETGVRDPSNRYTMTAAERRLYDAGQRYRLALQGIDPYASPGFGNTPDPFGQRLNRVGAATTPATPEIVDMAKRDYLRWLESNGEFFTH